jgi:sec-independent protein translocase protein TatA
MFDSIDDWLIIAVVIAILFYGSTKIPKLAHSLGRAMGEFKRGKMEVDREIRSEQAQDASTPASSGPTH